jgi:calcium-dependent protein kinase
VAILKQLDHPHIVKAFETFDYHNRLFLVLELCSGGDLYVSIRASFESSFSDPHMQ